MVMHVNGLHRVNVAFCGCPGHVTHRVQLLRSSWWPATPFAPRTCATLELLELFHCVSLQGKLNAFSFYRALELLTDATLLSGVPVSIRLV